MTLYDLFELTAWETGDPVHRTVDLWRGIDVAERYLDFSLEDIELLLKRYRATTIFDLSRIGAHFAAWAADEPRIRDGSHEIKLSREMRDKIRASSPVFGLRKALSQARGEAA